MEDVPLPSIQNSKEVIKSTFKIKQDEKNYKLKITIINQEIILNIFDEKDFMKEYEIKLTFDELKNLHKIFLTFNSCQDFNDFIKSSIKNKKILIKQNEENKITIEIMIEYIFKQDIIKFDLNQKKIISELTNQNLYLKFNKISEICKNLEMNYKNIIADNNILKEELRSIKEENNKIKEENKSNEEELKILKKENQKLNNEYFKIENKIKSIEDENKNLLNKINNLEVELNSSNKNLIFLNKNNISQSINSSILEKNEFDMIYSAIKKTTNKEIISIKKLYQATKDGGDPDNFHKCCDGISNTLVLYMSVGNRRFGVFSHRHWKNEGGANPDSNCFLFSLDKNKIYYNNFDIYNSLNEGPSFTKNSTYIIGICGNALINKALKTYETWHKDIFGGDGNALSEDGKFEGTNAKEYEVFQIIFK